MSVLIWILVMMVIYISSFKDEFNSEHVSKALGFVIMLLVVVVIINILFDMISA